MTINLHCASFYLIALIFSVKWTLLTAQCAHYRVNRCWCFTLKMFGHHYGNQCLLWLGSLTWFFKVSFSLAAVTVCYGKNNKKEYDHMMLVVMTSSYSILIYWSYYTWRFINLTFLFIEALWFYSIRSNSVNHNVP